MYVNVVFFIVVISLHNRWVKWALPNFGRAGAGDEDANEDDDDDSDYEG